MESRRTNRQPQTRGATSIGSLPITARNSREPQTTPPRKKDETGARRSVRTYDIKTGTNNTTGKTLDANVGALLSPIPIPNNFSAAGDGLNTASFVWNPPTAVRGPAINARIDHNFNANNSMFGRYLFSDYNTLKGDPLNGRPQVFPGGPAFGEVFRRTSNLALSYRRVISSRIVNELTAGYGRFEFLFTQCHANPK